MPMPVSRTVSFVSWSPWLRLFDRPVVLREADGERLIRLWNRLNRGPNAEQVQLTFSRLSMMAEHLNNEDKLIYYWIGLESLFTPDSRQELALRASLRIAAFLGQTPDERREIYGHMRHSYNWRSAIMHGDNRRKAQIARLEKKGTLSEITTKTRTYLIKAVLQIIESDRLFRPDRLELDLLGSG